MAVSIRQIHPVFFGEVSGVDLKQRLSPSDVAGIEAGMDRYAVLVFHDQNISDEEQIAFSRNFGEIDAAGGNVTKPTKNASIR
jgi:alpha-ketoglutarate-dependent 2,4-dichlorophenoxyacetate dioxygenase